MEGYRKLTEAVLQASTACLSWQCVSNEMVYSLYEMTIISQIVDNECPLSDERLFYVVFPDGEIGILCTEDKMVERLYLPLTGADSLEGAVRHDSLELEARKKEIEQAKALLDPLDARINSPKAQPNKMRFCPYCGNEFAGNALFCTKCGQKREG